jgi:hypothetical protein
LPAPPSAQPAGLRLPPAHTSAFDRRNFSTAKKRVEEAFIRITQNLNRFSHSFLEIWYFWPLFPFFLFLELKTASKHDILKKTQLFSRLRGIAKIGGMKGLLAPK